MTNRPFVSGLALLAACGGGSPMPPTVTDSAGVSIVLNHQPQWARGERWRVPEEPLVDIDRAGPGPSYEITRPAGAVRLADGAIVLAHGGTQELVWYDSNGGYVRTTGTGDFANIDWIGATPAGSVVVFDYGRLRVSIHSPQGELEEVISLVVSFQMEPGSVRGMFADSSYVLIQDARHWAQAVSRSGERLEGLVRGTASVARYSPGGEFMSDLGSFPGAERIFSRGRSRIVRISARPFGRDAVFAVARDHFYVGTQDSYEVQIHDINGMLETIVRVDRNNLPVTDGYVERYIRGRLANVHERERADREREIAQLPYPDSMPAYGPIAVDAGGNLWVAEYRPLGSGEPLWTIFDSQHRMLGTVQMPADLTVYEIGADYILGSFAESDGTQHIRIYAIEKPEPTG